MKVHVESQNKEPLFDRTGVIASVESEATPSRSAVLEAIAKAVKADAALVSVRAISQHFGTKGAKVEAFVYASADSKKKFDHAHLAKRIPEPKAEAPQQ